MLNLQANKIKSISVPAGNWYRVSGSRDEPKLEKVALWAVVEIFEISEDDFQKRHDYGDMVVGMSAREFSVIGLDPDAWTDSVAGYVELSQEEYERVIENPLRLPQESLEWSE